MTKHLPRLDSMRGIGAIMVGGFHAGSTGGSTLAGAYLTWILSFFFDGRTGVCIFFVLSGLVLGMSLRRLGSLNTGNYFHFCGRRFFRLYPAYFISTLFYLALYAVLRACLVRDLPTGHGWCDYYLRPDPWPWMKLVKNFFFLDQALNVASWTLKVEAQAALILPLLHAFSLRFGGKGEALLLFALIGLAFLSEGSTRIFLSLFYMGYLIPPLLEFIRTAGLAVKLRSGVWLFLFAISALIASHVFATKGFAWHFGVLLAGLGSTSLLMVILLESSHSFFSILDHRFVRFVGMISYSFYLFNLLSVDLVERAFTLIISGGPIKTFLSDWMVFPASIVLCLGLATASFYLIERPAVRLGGFLLPSRSVAQRA